MLFTLTVDIESRIGTMCDLAHINGNGTVASLTDGVLILCYLSGLQGETLTNGVVADDAIRTSAQAIKYHLDTLMPAL